MPRFRLAVALAATCAAALSCAVAQSPAVQQVVATAKQKLAEGRPSEAVQLLERHLPFADGDKEFRDTLRTAYAAELPLLTDPKAIDAARKNLSLMGGPPPAAEVPPPPPLAFSGALPPPSGAAGPADPFPLPPPVAPAAPPPPPAAPQPVPGLDLLKQATTAFNQARNDAAKFLEARDLFSLAFGSKLNMSAEQMTAWAYCRLKVATDTLNRTTDAQTAADMAAEIEDALAVSPDHAGLQNAGRDVLAAARKRAGGLAPKRKPDSAEAGWEAMETDNFRVKYRGKPGAAEQLARTAEEKRGAIFARWSAPPGRKWQPKCEIVLHPDSESFARATKLPAANTGRADVTLKDGEAVARRIDLRADDATATDDALPRELTHVVLADLFRAKAPPKWAALGMAVLAESPEQLGRYRATVVRCHRDGELPAAEKVVSATEVPAKSVTGFAVTSVSLVDFLVRWRGEKHFLEFVRDAQRYGIESELKRKYGVADVKQLETVWRKNALGN